MLKLAKIAKFILGMSNTTEMKLPKRKKCLFCKIDKYMSYCGDMNDLLIKNDELVFNF